MAKYTHEEVSYGPGRPNGDHCAVCEHYRKPHCEIVADPIKPQGWCRKFKAAPRARQAMKRGAVSQSAYRKMGNY